MPRKPTLLLMSTHRLEEDYYFEKMKRIPDVFASRGLHQTFFCLLLSNI
jgi:hypothetical protein